MTELALSIDEQVIEANKAISRSDAFFEQGTEKFKASCMEFWKLGKWLSVMRESVKHGDWRLFVCARMPSLGTTDEARYKKAYRALSLFEDNSNLTLQSDFSELTPESVRKWFQNAVPDKARPHLLGDKPINPTPHPLTFVNHYSKWWQQVRDGLIPPPPVDVFRRDMEATVKQIAEYGGADWIQSLL